MIDILIIGVCYNTPNETSRFLESIKFQNYSNLRVILVDNSDKLSSIDQLNTADPKLTCLKSPTNLGYFGGANFGLHYFMQENAIPRWIVVSNVDIVFNQKNFFDKLCSTSFPAETGIVAPAIISQKWKTDYNPKILHRYTLKKMQFYLTVCTNTFTQNLYMTLSYLKKILKLLIGSNKNSKGERKEIYAPHGSCILFNENYFKKGGTLKHISFLFGEEIFVAETAGKLGLKVEYDPQLIVSDYEHASTGFFYSNKIAGYMKQSTIDIIHNYYNDSSS